MNKKRKKKKIRSLLRQNSIGFVIKYQFVINFAKEITTYDSSLYMTSLDVESLFTNIPLNETINSVSDIHNKNLYNEKLSKRGLFKLLETTTRESSFIFD